MDAFAVAVSVGSSVKDITPAHTIRLSTVFGFFHFTMPVVGWLAGMCLHSTISAYDHWVAFGLLTLIGAKMIWESLVRKHKEMFPSDPTRGLLLLSLTVATTIDALAVGVSLAMLGVSIWYPSVIIGAVCGVLTAMGIHLGKIAGSLLGKYAGAFGGIVLCILGVKIVIEHLS
jgi:putative Mn2+ efflux pump MntP